MTNDGLNTMTYNGESRVVTSAQAGTTTTYTYDGSGLRVKKQVGAATPTVYVFSRTKVIAEYASGAAPGSPTKEYIYSGSALLATIESGAAKYHISDHLSMRVTTDANGVKIADSGHYPFGENWYETGGLNKLKFTSYERDAESGNDYAMMRTSVTRLGRFSSPDPLAGSIAAPQSLNRYAYVGNDPPNLADPLGLDCEAIWFNGGVQIICDPFNQGGGGGGGGHPIHPPLIDDPPDIGRITAPFDPSKFPTPQPPPPPGYEDCIKAALREVIATAEGTAGVLNNGYGRLVYGTVTRAPGVYGVLVGQTFTRLRPFDILNPETLTSGHPGIQVGVTSAFGRYQILASTARNYGFTDFTPSGQDAAANFLMRVRNMVVPAMNGNLMRGLRNGNREWTSLPGGTQENTSIDPASVFNNALNTLPECL